MSRLSILSVLVIGLPLIGCTETPAPPASKVAALQSETTPTGSHVKGGPADPFLLTVDPATTPNVSNPTDTKDLLLHSSASPFLQFSGR